MKPLKITFNLISPIVDNSQPLHLDALLAWAMVDAYEGGLPPTEAIRRIHDELPLEQYTSPVSDKSGWKASMVIFTTRGGMAGGNTSRFLTRRTEVEQIASLAESGGVKFKRTTPPSVIDTASGPLKSSLEFYPIRDCDKAYAWCIGDKDKITELLSRVGHIGKSGSRGHGKVSSILVQEDIEAREKWKLRVLNYAEPGYIQQFSAVRPPYWDSRNKEISWMPPISFMQINELK